MVALGDIKHFYDHINVMTYKIIESYRLDD